MNILKIFVHSLALSRHTGYVWFRTRPYAVLTTKLREKCGIHVIYAALKGTLQSDYTLLKDCRWVSGAVYLGEGMTAPILIMINTLFPES
jgi:hypothetical protein